MNYFELYPGDYLRDTSRLSMLEHGAYLRLLMAYYSEESPLPADLGELCTIAVATTPADRRAVAKVAERYFPIGADGMRHNGRADIEIEKAQRRIETARQNGSKGGRKPKPNGNPPGNPAGNPMGSSRGNPERTQRGTHSGEALHTPHATREAEAEKPTELRSVVPSRKLATPECPHEAIIAAYHETLPMLARVRDWTPQRQTLLRNAWRSRPERQSVDWWRGLFAYVAQSDFLTGKGKPRGDAPPFEADLEWIIRPKNLPKIVEGKYENRSAA